MLDNLMLASLSSHDCALLLLQVMVLVVHLSVRHFFSFGLVDGIRNIG